MASNQHLLVDRKFVPSPGQALLLAGYPEDAYAFLKRDNSPAGMVNQAIALRSMGKPQEALGLCLDMMQECPSASLFNTLGMIHDDLGLFHSGLYYFRESNKRQQHHQISLNLACSLMRQQLFEEAWTHWENARLGQSWTPTHLPWNGEDASVLVISEGGYGDAFLFSRFLRLLPNDESEYSSITFAVWDELKDFGWDVPSVGISEEIDMAVYDRSTSLLSLMSILDMKSIGEIPPDSRDRLPVPRTGAWGICWAAEENGVMRRTRSIRVADLEPLRELDRHWVSLCPGRDTPDWIEQVPINSWHDTVKILSGLDGVVTVDTAVAHLACLYNIPTMILVPKNSDWKWFTKQLCGQASPWWPSATILRNPHPAGWEAAISDLASCLQKNDLQPNQQTSR